jgi:hypothetical protein
MFPKILYELLPFIYLSVGFGSGVIINSTIVIVASILLISAGILVLSLRIRYRRAIRHNRHS